MSALAGRRRRSIDYWPGFVDALSSLLMVLVFVLLIYTIGQFVLADQLSGRDQALTQLRAELAQLADVLAMEKRARTDAELRIGELSASLESTRAERDGLLISLGETEAQLSSTQIALEGKESELAKAVADLAALTELKRQLEAEIASRLAELDEESTKLVEQTQLTNEARAQIELLNRQLLALRTQLGELQAALDLERAQSTAKDSRIEDLGKQLNLALANRVNELNRYRSDFFGKLREILGNRSDIQVVGDRFVVPSELLFASGSDELTPAARARLDSLAQTLREVSADIPPEIDWVLRIDGHTDKRPINTPRFPSNWELSSARAIAIVKYLVVAGIPANRLAANGFGEFRPLDPASTDAAYAINRRIEIQLTNR